VSQGGKQHPKVNSFGLLGADKHDMFAIQHLKKSPSFYLNIMYQQI